MHVICHLADSTDQPTEGGARRLPVRLPVLSQPILLVGPTCLIHRLSGHRPARPRIMWWTRCKTSCQPLTDVARCMSNADFRGGWLAAGWPATGRCDHYCAVAVSGPYSKL